MLVEKDTSAGMRGVMRMVVPAIDAEPLIMEAKRASVQLSNDLGLVRTLEKAQVVRRGVAMKRLWLPVLCLLGFLCTFQKIETATQKRK